MKPDVAQLVVLQPATVHLGRKLGLACALARVGDVSAVADGGEPLPKAAARLVADVVRIRYLGS
jgi:hypothetical protein